MNTYTIKDLENLTGVKAHTIRIWEQRYSFLKPQRTGTNIRYYNAEELKKILNIALLNKYGYKISHIDRMSEEDIRLKIISLGQAEAQTERIINELVQYMIDLDLDSFEDLLDQHIKARGIERSINQIIFPFMERIGMLWITDHINPAQEHLVTNIIRQKLIVGIESTVSHVRIEASVLLFLPEGEYHELGLLYMQYLLRSRGVRTLYLGTNVPLEDVEFVNRLRKPDYLYTHLTSVSHGFNFEKFLQQASRRFGSTPVVLSGRLALAYENKVPPSFQFKRSFPEVMEFVASLR